MSLLEPNCRTMMYVLTAWLKRTPWIICSYTAHPLEPLVWKVFQNRWTNKTKQQLALSNSRILYGIFDQTDHRYFLNYMFLIAKFSIY